MRTLLHKFAGNLSADNAANLLMAVLVTFIIVMGFMAVTFANVHELI